MSTRMAFSGGIAGALSALIFAVVHGFMISDIWFSLPMLLLAGALCGTCLGTTYSMLCNSPSLRSWAGYNAIYVAFFLAIAVVSELVYEPIITLGELMAHGPPSYLWGKTIPLVGICTLFISSLLFFIFGRTWFHFLALLATSAVLVLLLGLNISLLGLVYLPVQSFYLVAEAFGLILTLNLVYAIGFVCLERKQLLTQPPSIPLVTEVTLSDHVKGESSS